MTGTRPSVVAARGIGGGAQRCGLHVQQSAAAAAAPLLSPREKPDARQQLARVLGMPEGSLRGVPLPELLGGAAGLFANRGQAAKDDPVGTYLKSRPVESIDCFASHSWSCPRWLKYFALITHFNLDAAVAAVAATHAVVFTLELLYHDSELLTPFMLPQPNLGDMNVCAGRACAASTLCQTLAPLVFWVVLCTAHRFRQPSPNVFLDICCIDQTSDAAKARGITSLGAILDRSERMLALVSSDYFSRLWCVFEYAAFYQRTGGGSRIDHVPVHKAMSTLGFIFSYTVFYILYDIGAWCSSPNALTSTANVTLLTGALTMLIGSIPGTVLQVWAEFEMRETRESFAKLRRFDLQSHTQCYSDADRAALIDLIAQWFSDSHSCETGPEGVRQEGIHRFETFVRFELAPRLNRDLDELSPLPTLAVTQCVVLGWFLDTYAMPAVTATYDFVVILCLTLVFAVLWLPCAVRSLRLGAWLGATARELCPRCCSCAALAYVVALATVNALNYLNWCVLWALPSPNLWRYSANTSAWRSPVNADGLEDDPIARKAAKLRMLLLSMCAVLLCSKMQRR